MPGPVALAQEETSPPAADCPAGPPAEYLGSDDAAAELRELRHQVADLCTAEVDRLDAVIAAVDGLRSEFQSGSANVQVGNVVGVEPVPGSEVRVSNPSEYDSEPIVASIEDARIDLRRDIWGVAGILVGLAAIAAFFRAIRP